MKTFLLYFVTAIAKIVGGEIRPESALESVIVHGGHSNKPLSTVATADQRTTRLVSENKRSGPVSAGITVPCLAPIA